MRATLNLHWLASSLLVLLFAVGNSGLVIAQIQDELASLSAQVAKLNEEGKYTDATELGRRALTLAERQFGPEHPETANNLIALAGALSGLRLQADAAQFELRAIAIRTKVFGRKSLLTAEALYGYGGSMLVLRDYARAEAALSEALSIREAIVGKDDATVISWLGDFVRLRQEQGRFDDAAAFVKRAHKLDVPTDIIALDMKIGALVSGGKAKAALVEAEGLLAMTESKLGKKHPRVGSALSWLSVISSMIGNYSAALTYGDRAIAVLKISAPETQDLIDSTRQNMASIHIAEGRLEDAEAQLNLLMDSFRRQGKQRSAPYASIANNLAVVYRAQARYSEAESLIFEALEIYERSYGAVHEFTSAAVNSLASLRFEQGRIADAETLYRRGLVIAETILDPNHPDLAIALSNLASTLHSADQRIEAMRLYERAIRIQEIRLGAEHPGLATTLNNLAVLHQDGGIATAAEPYLRRSLAIREKSLGPDHPDVAGSLSNLGSFYVLQKRYNEARTVMLRSWMISQDRLGVDHPQVISILDNLGTLERQDGNWTGAAEYWRLGTAAIIRRNQRSSASGVGHSTSFKSSNAQETVGQFVGLIKALNRLASRTPAVMPGIVSETFTTAQWAQGSEAAASLAQMAARGAAGNAGLALIVRERQDLVREWQRRDNMRTIAVSQSPERRDAKAELANIARIAEIDTRIATIDKRLTAEFPDYAALASPVPLTVEQVQADLRPDEALVLFLDTPKSGPTPEETFIWVVTQTDVRWVRSGLGKPALMREVAALRCGLDATAWYGEGGERCAELLTLTPDEAPSGSMPLPFDHARAHALYKALFGKAGDLIKGKHLLLVPSGALTRLPFQVLVTEPPSGGDHKATRWLARDHELTVLPAVSSLKVLRRVATPSTATMPMIGFGNPLLDGNQGHARNGAFYKQQAALARTNKDCVQAPTNVTSQLRGLSRSPAPISQSSRIADVAQIRLQSPLPETADELCAVARDLKADVGEMRLGARATEREVKSLSASGKLADFRIVHFATHGTLAGQLSGTSEPGLILTPPDNGTEDDDGYLSAGEIAGLKLDADWVILSACNTAGGANEADAAGAEALSGLARAFFYAQARALLVSHWEVNSEATVKLITSAVNAMSRDKSVGRAEALRRAMLAMIDTGQPHEAHPAYWAPFVVVGEGAAARPAN